MLTVAVVLFAVVGCEKNHDCDRNDSDPHGTQGAKSSSETTIVVESGTGSASATTPVTPVTQANPQITVANSSSYTVAVNGSAVGSGSSKTWQYNGSTTVTYDTRGGYSVSQTISDGRSWIFNIYNSQGVPGTVEMSGEAE